MYFYDDNQYIGRVHSVNIWEDKILLTDFFLCNLWVFTESLEFIRTVGRKGEGPGEYRRAPRIIVDKNNFWLHRGKFIDFYDKGFNLQNRYSLPAELIFTSSDAIAIENNLILNVAYPYSMAKNSYYTKYKALAVFDKITWNYTPYEEWDNDYHSNKKLDAFTKENARVLLSNGKDSDFFSLQRGTYRIKHKKPSFETKIIFGTKPKYFKKPPQKTLMETQESIETVADFISKTTKMMKLSYDNINKRVFLNYTNLYKDFYIKRSLMWGKHYLQVFNENYDCIYDGEIPGLLAFINKGKIYVITEEKPEYLKIKIYELVNNKPQ